MAMKTPYSQKNQEFTDQAHLCARRDIYPTLFGVPQERIKYPELPDAKERDYEKGIDKTLEIWVPSLDGSIKITSQERFRRPKFARYRDITITQQNNTSGLNGEIYKIEAGLFVYGYYDPERDRFIEAIACWLHPLIMSIVNEQIHQEVNLNHRSNQDFLCFKFEDLASLPGVVAFHKKWNGAA
jgi:hypothetical protein